MLHFKHGPILSSVTNPLISILGNEIVNRNFTFLMRDSTVKIGTEDVHDCVCVQNNNQRIHISHEADAVSDTWWPNWVWLLIVCGCFSLFTGRRWEYFTFLKLPRKGHWYWIGSWCDWRHIPLLLCINQRCFYPKITNIEVLAAVADDLDQDCLWAREMLSLVNCVNIVQYWCWEFPVLGLICYIWQQYHNYVTNDELETCRHCYNNIHSYYLKLQTKCLDDSYQNRSWQHNAWKPER